MGEKNQIRKTKYFGVYYRELKSKFNNKPDKSYYIRFTKDGKQELQFIGKKSQGYTAQYVANMKSDLMTKKVNLKFKDLYNNFMSWAKINKKSWFTDEQFYRNHVENFLANKYVNDIKAADINNLIMHMKKSKKSDGKNYAPQTIKHIQLLISRIYNFNIKLGYIHENPAEHIEMEKFDNNRIAYLTDEEIEKLINYLDNSKNLWDNDIAMVKIALFTGLRRGELFNLEWQNLDLNNNIIKIFDTKGGKNETIIISNLAKEIFFKMKHYDQQYVFPSSRGGKRNTFSKKWMKIKKESKIRNTLRFHDLRHTFATLATSSIPLKTVQKMLTHKSIQTTLKYAHIKQKELIDGANKINDIFSEKINKDCN